MMPLNLKATYAFASYEIFAVYVLEQTMFQSTNIQLQSLITVGKKLFCISMFYVELLLYMKEI